MPLTRTEKAQLEAAGRVAPDRLIVPDPGVAVIVPPSQAPVNPFGLATTSPEGSGSLNPTDDSESFGLGFTTENKSVVVSPGATDFAPKDLRSTGGSITVNEAEALFPVSNWGSPLPLSYAPLTLSVVLSWLPPAIPITFTERVQLLPPGMPTSESEIEPVPGVADTAPPMSEMHAGRAVRIGDTQPGRERIGEADVGQRGACVRVRDRERQRRRGATVDRARPERLRERGRRDRRAGCHVDRGRVARAAGAGLGGADGAGCVVELFDQARIGGGGAGRAADGQEESIIVNQAAAAEDAARIQLEIMILIVMFIATRPMTGAGWPWISARPEFESFRSYPS